MVFSYFLVNFCVGCAVKLLPLALERGNRDEVMVQSGNNLDSARHVFSSVAGR